MYYLTNSTSRLCAADLLTFSNISLTGAADATFFHAGDERPLYPHGGRVETLGSDSEIHSDSDVEQGMLCALHVLCLLRIPIFTKKRKGGK